MGVTSSTLWPNTRTSLTGNVDLVGDRPAHSKSYSDSSSNERKANEVLRSSSFRSAQAWNDPDDPECSLAALFMQAPDAKKCFLGHAGQPSRAKVPKRWSRTAVHPSCKVLDKAAATSPQGARANRLVEKAAVTSILALLDMLETSLHVGRSRLDPADAPTLAECRHMVGGSVPDVRGCAARLHALAARVQESIEKLGPLSRPQPELELIQLTVLRVREALPDAHLELAQSLMSLAQLCHSQGRFDEAVSYFLRLASVVRTSLGCEHPDFAVALNFLAESLGRAGRVADALNTCKRAVAVATLALGAAHPHTQGYRRNLRVLQGAQERQQKPGATIHSSGNVASVHPGSSHTHNMGAYTTDAHAGAFAHAQPQVTPAGHIAVPGAHPATSMQSPLSMAMVTRNTSAALADALSLQVRPSGVRVSGMSAWDVTATPGNSPTAHRTNNASDSFRAGACESFRAGRTQVSPGDARDSIRSSPSDLIAHTHAFPPTPSSSGRSHLRPVSPAIDIAIALSRVACIVPPAAAAHNAPHTPHAPPPPLGHKRRRSGGSTGSLSLRSLSPSLSDMGSISESSEEGCGSPTAPGSHQGATPPGDGFWDSKA
eukprot:jgi/Mesvir1/18563/Mv17076-RA.1